MKDWTPQHIGDLLVRILPILKGSPLAKGGLLFAVIAGGILTQSWLYAVFAYLTGASFQDAVEAGGPGPAATIIAVVCLAISAVMLLAPFVMEHRKRPPTVIAVEHQSFQGHARGLAAQELPAALRKADIKHLVVNLSHSFESGVLTDPKAALRDQARFKPQLTALLTATPDARVAYCGKAHIPLAFTLAHSAFTEIPILYCELDRTTGGWRALTETGPDLGVSSRVNLSDGPPAGPAVITVEISYPIKSEDVRAIIPVPAASAAISIAQPRIDCVTANDQVAQVAKLFRDALDAFQGYGSIHVFLAAPISVVIALGRLMSPSIHGSVTVYNFTDKTEPHYAWGIDVNAQGGPKVVMSPKPKKDS